MKYPKGFAVAALCAAFVALAWPAAALVEQLSLEDLTTRASLIVVGRVTSAVSTSAGGAISTRVSVVPTTFVKGSAPAPITFDVPGGTVGGIRLEVEDVPSFEPGEEVFLFLRDEFFRVVGWYQGKLPIRDGKVVGPNVPLPDFAASVKEIVKRTSPEAAARADAANLQPIPEPASLVREGPARSGLPSSAPAPGAGPEPAGWVTIFSDDFEGGFPGPWQLYGDPTWGQTSYDSYSGSYSIWCAAGGINGVDPADGYYPTNVESWAVYGPFNLSNATDAELLFKYNTWTTSNKDYFYWLASVNDINYYGYRTSGNSGGWAAVNFDLTAVPVFGNFCGQSQVWIAFVFQSDQHWEYLPGTYVDDVLLQKFTSGGGPVPAITSIEPAIGSAGTGTQVTITGTNFGTQDASSKVEFFYRSGQPKIAAPLISWSDTKIVCEVPTGYVSGYPASAGSGPVTVTTSAGTSNGYNFSVTFGYGGIKWTNLPASMSYRINENTADCVGEGAEVQTAATTWTNAGALFAFQYTGSHTNTTYGYNGFNDIMWGSTGGSIATTYTWYIGDQFVECDMVLDDSYTWSTSCESGKMDIQTVGLHELGHCLNLRDIYGDGDSSKVMYGFGSFGLCKRALTSGDSAGIFWIYNSGSIGQGKKTGGTVVWAAKPVTGAYTNFFYIEEADRSAGIRVDWTGSVNVADLVNLVGTISQTPLGEPKLGATYVFASGTYKVPPLLTNVRSAAQALSEALLFRCFGNASYVDPGSQFFYLDDGSGPIDTSGNQGIRVLCPGLIPPGQGTNVTITGVRSRDTVGPGPAPVVRLRTQADIE